MWSDHGYKYSLKTYETNVTATNNQKQKLKANGNITRERRYLSWNEIIQKNVFIEINLRSSTLISDNYVYCLC